METKQSQRIVQDTLQNDFDKDRFLYFIKNLLNKEVDESKAFHARGYVPEAYKNYVKTYERLATYTDPEDNKIDILVVYLQKETSLERARTTQRNFIAHYLKERGQKEAGLVAFVSPDLANWRFSLVKMDYKFVEDKKGRTKVKEEFTPARRWSFLVGTNENSHTAKRQFLPLLEDDKNKPTLKRLEEAFNIEKVTKEFFEKYRDLFLRVSDTLQNIVRKDSALKIDFEEKNVSIVDFSKKLLGQIVFLYFLQKKGWFGVPMGKRWGEGNKKFLRTLFEGTKSEKRNYFNDYLEPLFYEALAKERDDDFYSRFDCKIPFLNGGLFDPIGNYDWVNTCIDMPNDLFSNDRKTKEGDTGDGILDLFDRYNFTVKEDEPLEKEVAVDPEMLGKVFENLLDVKDRKSKGTYYTPREIVHYMCEQSLVSFLATKLENKVPKEDLEQLIRHGEAVNENEARVENEGRETDTYYYKLSESIRNHAKEIDTALADIKVCDPAIGSGAFPVGMMNEIVKVRMTLDSYLKLSRTLYYFKFHCIQNSLYGVDIDPGAVEIAKLRLWLSLVVDEDDIKQIKPLPNLDYKIMQGNSLLEEFEGIKLFDETIIATADTSREGQIQSLKHRQSDLQREYLDLDSREVLTPIKKAELKTELDKIAAQLKKIATPEKTDSHADLFDRFSAAKQKGEELKRLHKEFFETTQKTKKDNLKSRIDALEWDLIEATLKEQNKISELKKLEQFKKTNMRPFFLWKLNFAEVFEKNGGFDVVIENPPYVQIKGIPEKERRIFEERYKFATGRFNLFYLFLERCKLLLKKEGVATFIIPDRILLNTQCKVVREWLLNENSPCELVSFGDQVFESAVVDSILLIFKKQKRSSSCIRAKRKVLENDLQKVEAVDIPVSYFELSPSAQFDLNYSPSKHGLLSKLKSNSVALGTVSDTKDGIIQGKVEDKLFLKTKLDKDSKPLLFGANIECYQISFTHDWVNYKPQKMMGLEITRRGEGVRPGLWMRTPSIFECPKILTRQTADEIIAAYDEENYYYANTLHGTVITDKNYHPLFLLGVLNSKITTWFYRSSTDEGGKVFAQIKIELLRQLPIPKTALSNQKSVIKLVERVQAAKKQNPKADTTSLEQEIDGLVYTLYDLTKEEIEIVENSGTKT